MQASGYQNKSFEMDDRLCRPFRSFGTRVRDTNFRLPCALRLARESERTQAFLGSPKCRIKLFMYRMYITMYVITAYTREAATRLGVIVKPSTSSGKKIDVYRDGKKIASIGATGYSDYPTYVKSRGKAYADERRRLYKQRHEKDRHAKWTAGYLADQLLW